MIKFTPDEILNVPIYIYTFVVDVYGILWDMIISGINQVYPEYDSKPPSGGNRTE